MVHGFRGKPALLRQLEEAQIQVSLHPLYSWDEVPKRPFFIETDESDLPLRTIYSRVAKQLGEPLTELSQRILSSYSRLLTSDR